MSPLNLLKRFKRLNKRDRVLAFIMLALIAALLLNLVLNQTAKQSASIPTPSNAPAKTVIEQAEQAPSPTSGASESNKPTPNTTVKGVGSLFVRKAN